MLSASASLAIRPATDADGTGMAALIARIFDDYENCPFVLDEFPELGAPARHYRSKGGELWVVPHPSDPTMIEGSIAITPTHEKGVAELFKVYLAHQWRGSGLADRLLATAFEWARAHQCHAVRLWSDTRFLSGHRFYEKNGFVRLPGIRLVHDSANTLEYGFHLPLDAKRPA
jgi:putative acetyltransferase